MTQILPPLIASPARVLNGRPLGPWQTIESGEEDVFSISAHGVLGATEQIETAVWACGVIGAGVDPHARTRIGRSSFSGNVLSVLAGGFVPGVRYILEVTFTTSVPGVIRKLSSTVLCVPSLVPSPPLASGLSFVFSQPSNLILAGAI